MNDETKSDRRSDAAADNLPRLRPALSGRKHVIEALDGRAEVWVHPGDADLPPSVVLDLTASAGGDEKNTLGVSLTRHAALELVAEKARAVLHDERNKDEAAAPRGGVSVFASSGVTHPLADALAALDALGGSDA